MPALIEDPSDEDVAQALREFFQRSVNSRPPIPPRDFRVESDQQSFNTTEFRPAVPQNLMAPDAQPLINPVPTINSFFPYWAGTSQQPTVDVQGTNFLNPSYVRLVVQSPTSGGTIISVPNSSVTFVKDTHIKFVAPSIGFSLPNGYVDCELQVGPDPNFPNGSYDGLASFQYEIAPVSDELAGFTPNFGLTLAGGGTRVLQYQVFANDVNFSTPLPYPFIGNGTFSCSWGQSGQFSYGSNGTANITFSVPVSSGQLYSISIHAEVFANFTHTWSIFT